MLEKRGCRKAASCFFHKMYLGTALAFAAEKALPIIGNLWYSIFESLSFFGFAVRHNASGRRIERLLFCLLTEIGRERGAAGGLTGRQADPLRHRLPIRPPREAGVLQSRV